MPRPAAATPLASATGGNKPQYKIAPKVAATKSAEAPVVTAAVAPPPPPPSVAKEAPKPGSALEDRQ